MKAKELIEVYKLLREAKMTKMKDADKFKIIKIMHVLKPKFSELADFETDAREKLKDDKFSEMQAKAQKWQQEGEKTTLTSVEKEEINAYFGEYNKKITDCLKDEFEKELKLKFDKIDDKALESLLASNDFNVEQSTSLYEALV
jgi:hypothetical protein